MKNVWTIFKRELGGYFLTPVAYVFIVIFLFLSGLMTFGLGGLYERGQADLRPFFDVHPWLYLFLMPAVAMRLWAEERRSGTVELLMTLPVSKGQAVLGKFLAAWLFAAIALALTFPIWISVAYLGEPDHGVIAASYLGSLLMAGSYLAIGSCISSITKNQVIAFVISVVTCFLFMLTGIPPVIDFLGDFLPELLLDTVASFSFITHFESIAKGVIDARDVFFFATLILFWLFANSLILDVKKAD